MGKFAFATTVLPGVSKVGGRMDNKVQNGTGGEAAIISVLWNKEVIKFYVCEAWHINA